MEKAFSKGVSLWKRPLCNGSSLCKRLLAKGFLNEKALCKGHSSLENDFFMEKGYLQRADFMEKVLCKGFFFWNRLFAEWFPY